jgi:uncharacterized protein (TIGR02466 family)
MKKKEFKIEVLFPTPVVFSKLNRKFNKKELDFFEKEKNNSYRIIGNEVSNDKYVLNNPVFNSLKKELDLMVKEYFDKIICATKDVTPYITQSWLSYTKKNEFHHKHAHPNSIVSGVLYIDTDEKNDKIKFFNDTYKQIAIEVNEYNKWNSESWWFPVKKGELILFPSSLTHMVETKEGNNTRISLAFNVFVKGRLGIFQGSTELIIK